MTKNGLINSVLCESNLDDDYPSKYRGDCGNCGDALERNEDHICTLVTEKTDLNKSGYDVLLDDDDDLSPSKSELASCYDTDNYAAVMVLSPILVDDCGVQIYIVFNYKKHVRSALLKNLNRSNYVALGAFNPNLLHKNNLGVIGYQLVLKIKDVKNYILQQQKIIKDVMSTY